MRTETLKSSNEKGKSKKTKKKQYIRPGDLKWKKFQGIQEDSFKTASFIITKNPEKETKSLQAVDWNISKD